MDLEDEVDGLKKELQLFEPGSRISRISYKRYSASCCDLQLINDCQEVMALANSGITQGVHVVLAFIYSTVYLESNCTNYHRKTWNCIDCSKNGWLLY